MKHTDDMDDAALDRLLAKVPPQGVPAPLARRILADYDRLEARWTPAKALRLVFDAVWPGAPIWQPACAIVLAAMIGLGVAAFAPLDLQSSENGSSGGYGFNVSPDYEAAQDV